MNCENVDCDEEAVYKQNCDDQTYYFCSEECAKINWDIYQNKSIGVQIPSGTIDKDKLFIEILKDSHEINNDINRIIFKRMRFMNVPNEKVREYKRNNNNFRLALENIMIEDNRNLPGNFFNLFEAQKNLFILSFEISGEPYDKLSIENDFKDFTKKFEEPINNEGENINGFWDWMSSWFDNPDATYGEYMFSFFKNVSISIFPKTTSRVINKAFISPLEDLEKGIEINGSEAFKDVAFNASKDNTYANLVVGSVDNIAASQKFLFYGNLITGFAQTSIYGLQWAKDELKLRRKITDAENMGDFELENLEKTVDGSMWFFKKVVKTVQMITYGYGIYNLTTILFRITFMIISWKYFITVVFLITVYKSYPKAKAVATKFREFYNSISGTPNDEVLEQFANELDRIAEEKKDR